MGAAKRVRRDDPDRLEQAIYEVLRPRVSREEAREELAEALLLAIRGRFAVGLRKPRARRETQRALMMRLPDVGVEWTMSRNQLLYTLRIVTDHCIEVEAGGEVKRFPSLKAVATAIQGYPPSFSGWQFFFGTMSRDEVLARYGRKL